MEDTHEKTAAAESIETAAYLSRIGLDNPIAVADLPNLKLLQRQHLLNVPFENLDIHWGRPITLDVQSFFRKIVGENRGGFCYELNGLFNQLLRQTGFETRLLSARVSAGEGGYSPEYDHLAILVMIGEMQYLADVGFGAFSVAPLQFVGGIEQEDEAGLFMIRRQDAEYFDVAKKEGDAWRSEYMFRPFGRDLSEFAGMCEFHQSSLESHFKKNKICSILTHDGRKTLTDAKFIVTGKAGRTETKIHSPNEFDRILLSEFGISKTQRSEDAVRRN